MIETNKVNFKVEKITYKDKATQMEKTFDSIVCMVNLGGQELQFPVEIKNCPFTIRRVILSILAETNK